MTLPLPPFTLIGATTRAGLLTTPLRDRFGVCHRLEHYDPEHLAEIVERSAGILEVEIDAEGARDDRRALARHAAGRQPAAEAGARLRPGQGARARSTPSVAAAALEMLEVDAGGPRPQRPRPARHGRDQVRRRPGRALDPGGRDRRGAGHDRGRLEPYLLQQGLLKRTPRGRVLTERAYEHLGLPMPEGAREPLLEVRPSQ